VEEELLGRLRSALVERYAFERELGRGGAAVVYLARDRKHDRSVAVKVLLPHVAAAIGGERFQREITIAARLTHPHILPLHDSGEAGGLLYYVMPFMRGESLRDRMSREGRLPIEDALRIGVEVSSALECAHREGIIHRDIKPENILVEGGFAIVADFGIARVTSATDNVSITQTGTSLGTPLYMSPEQAVGAQDIDGRSDLYSLACVVYEMLAGHPPYSADSVRQMLMRHSMDPVPSLRAARPGVPEHVSEAVGMAMAKDPRERFATVADFAEALTRATAHATLTEGLWGLVRSVFTKPTPQPSHSAQRTRAPATPSPTAAPPHTRAASAVSPTSTPMSVAGQFVTTPSGRVPIESLAVLPFTTIGADVDSEYLAEGITESIMNKLSGVVGLRVVPRSVVFRYKGRDMDPSDIAKEVNARAVVTGRIMQRGDTLVIKAELVDSVTDSQLWGDQYNRRLSDIFAVQEEMATEIVRSLRHKLSGQEQAGLAKRFTESTKAYQAYLRGRHHWNKRTVEGLRQAIEHFQEAIDVDPSYALAHAGLADTFNILGYYNTQRPHDAYPRGKAAAARALALDESLAEAHASMGYIQVFYDYDWPGAAKSFLRAIELNPKYATAHQWYAWYLFVMERFDEALTAMRRAQELDPLSLIINDHLGYALLNAGKPEEALAQLVMTRELDPGFPWTYWRLGTVYLALDRPDEAVAAFDTVVQKTNGGVGLGYKGLACAEAGRIDEAQAVLARLETLRETRYVSPLEFALVYAGVGRLDDALASLQSAYDDRVSDFARVNLLPWPEAVRRDERFVALLRRMRLRS
jgi:serine/threonine protein kinase/tetratricopeptide (TPR) repeat protein